MLLIDAFETWARLQSPPAGTLSRYRQAVKSFSTHAVVTTLEELSPEAFADYQSDRSGEGISPATLNVDLAALVTISRFYAKRKQVSAAMPDDLAALKLSLAELPPPTFYTLHEYAELRARAPEVRPWLRFVLDVLTYSGVRVSEGVRIDRSDLDLGEEPVLRVSRARGGTKSHKERIVPVCPEFLEILRADAPDSGPLFPTAQRSRTRYPSALHLTSRSVQEAVAELGKLTGIPATPHKSRRTFATWALREGVPPPLVAKWLGHADLTILYRHYYAHIPGYDPAVKKFRLIPAA